MRLSLALAHRTGRTKMTSMDISECEKVFMNEGSIWSQQLVEHSFPF